MTQMLSPFVLVSPTSIPAISDLLANAFIKNEAYIPMFCPLNLSQYINDVYSPYWSFDGLYQFVYIRHECC